MNKTGWKCKSRPFVQPEKHKLSDSLPLRLGYKMGKEGRSVQKQGSCCIRRGGVYSSKGVAVSGGEECTVARELLNHEVMSVQLKGSYCIIRVGVYSS